MLAPRPRWKPQLAGASGVTTAAGKDRRPHDPVGAEAWPRRAAERQHQRTGRWPCRTVGSNTERAGRVPPESNGGRSRSSHAQPVQPRAARPAAAARPSSPPGTRRRLLPTKVGWPRPSTPVPQRLGREGGQRRRPGRADPAPRRNGQGRRGAGSAWVRFRPPARRHQQLAPWARPCGRTTVTATPPSASRSAAISPAGPARDDGCGRAYAGQLAVGLGDAAGMVERGRGCGCPGRGRCRAWRWRARWRCPAGR